MAAYELFGAHAQVKALREQAHAAATQSRLIKQAEEGGGRPPAPMARRGRRMTGIAVVAACIWRTADERPFQ